MLKEVLVKFYNYYYKRSTIDDTEFFYFIKFKTEAIIN